MTRDIYDEFDGNPHLMAAEIARLRLPLTETQLIAWAHELGLHTKGNTFHEECPTCLKTAVDGYIDECNEILHGFGKAGDIVAFHDWFVPIATNGMALHDEPVYVLAAFLGIDGIGNELEANPEFQALDAVASPIRERRLLTSLRVCRASSPGAADAH